MGKAESWVMVRFGYVETLGTIARKHGRESPAADRFEAEWATIETLEVTDRTAGLAVDLMVEQRLRSLDALHLSAALSFASGPMGFATWDWRLWQAAERCGFEMLPERL
jgi:predicted nucleic acid-binding protein